MSAYFAPLVTLPVIIDAPGQYLTRCGEIVTVRRTSMRNGFECTGEYSSGVVEAWHRSGRLYSSLTSRNDIVAKAPRSTT
jgi:hypothetical protein